MKNVYGLRPRVYPWVSLRTELISAQADDDNKVFGIVFRTPVKDSTGVPHILEHSVLCGSDKCIASLRACDPNHLGSASPLSLSVPAVSLSV